MEAEPETKVIERESSTKGESAQVLEAPVVGKTVGRYELIHRLGHGGMAAVYLGRATGRAGFEKLVAVKVIHPHLAEEQEFVEMFLDEARIAARLHHPHIVEIHDLGEGDGMFFMVMEYVEGETLASLLRLLRKREERLPLSAVLQVMADACEGLAAAHDLTHPDGRPMHLVHRDVSPHNLLVGMDGRVKVVDFGIAKATGRRSSTRTGQLRGKLAYMSPEQAGGDPIDHRTDLFALGAVMWELLTNERLFMAETESETLARVSACKVPDIREHREDLPENVAVVIERALARDPDDRFATAHDMLRELRALLRARGAEIEPRDELAAVMERLFSARVGYIRAAVRRASASGARVPAANDPISPEDATRATQRPAEASSSASSPRPATGSQPVLGPTTNTHTLTSSIATAPARHWGLWLLLPLIGAAVGAAIVSGGLGRETTPPVEATAPPPTTPKEPTEPATGATPEPPAPVNIKWYFHTEPSGASITLNGEALEGPSPVMVEVPRGEQAIKVEIVKDGYVTIMRRYAPLISNSFSFQLDPVPVPVPVPIDKPTPRSGPRNGKRDRPTDSGDPPESTTSDGGSDDLPPMPDFTKAGGKGSPTP